MKYGPPKPYSSCVWTIAHVWSGGLMKNSASQNAPSAPALDLIEVVHWAQLAVIFVTKASEVCLGPPNLVWNAFWVNGKSVDAVSPVT